MDSKRSNYKDFNWAIELNRLSFKMIGVWPGNHEVTKNNFISNIHVSFIFIMITLVLVIPFIWSLIRVWSDMILMIDNLQVTLPVVMACLKLVVMRWKRSAISLIVNMMAEDWMHLSVDAERYVMIKQMEIARLFAIYMYSIGMIAFIIVVAFPTFGIQNFRLLTNLTDSGRVLPMQTYYFYDTNKSPQFELTVAAQFIMMFFAVVIYISVDAFFVPTIFHICSQLKNFRYRLHNLVLYNDFNNTLRYIVETHLRLIRFLLRILLLRYNDMLKRDTAIPLKNLFLHDDLFNPFANNIEDVFALLMFILLLYFVVVFCIYGFLFVIVTSDETSNYSFSRIGFSVIGCIILLAHTFFYCGGGQLIATECEAVYRVLCDLEWYKLEPRESRALILLMIRTSEPFRLTAGKIFPLSMVTFCSILKTSVGYISFLLAKRI